MTQKKCIYTFSAPRLMYVIRNKKSSHGRNSRRVGHNSFSLSWSTVMGKYTQQFWVYSWMERQTTSTSTQEHCFPSNTLTSERLKHRNLSAICWLPEQNVPVLSGLLENMQSREPEHSICCKVLLGKYQSSSFICSPALSTNGPGRSF